MMAFPVTLTTGLLNQQLPSLLAWSEALLGTSSLFRHCDPNRYSPAPIQNVNSHRGIEFIILTGCNYLLAVRSERFFCVPKNSYPEEREQSKQLPLAVPPKQLLACITMDRLFNLWEFNLIFCFRNKMMQIDALIVHILWAFSCFI